MDDFIGTHKRDETPKYIVQLLVPKTYFLEFTCLVQFPEQMFGK